MMNWGLDWRVYDNGKLDTVINAPCSLKNIQLTSNYIGRSNWNENRLLIGKFAKFQIHEKFLSASDVDTIYNRAYHPTGIIETIDKG